MIRRRAALFRRCVLFTCAWAGVASSKPPKPAEEKVVLEEDEDEAAPAAEETPREAEGTGKVVLEEEAEPEEEHPAKGPADDEKPRKRPPSAWLQLGLVQDFTVVSGSEVCTPANQIDGNFTCIRASGSQYHGTPLPGAAGDASAFALGPTRVALAVDIPLGGPFAAGLRAGYAFLGQGPTPDGGKTFLPWHVEARASYWFTGEAFSTDHIGVFALLSGGIAQVDGKATVTVREDPSVPPPVSQLDNPPVQELEAWHKAGAGFAGAGAGAFLPLGARFGVLADLRGTVLFPAPGFALSAGISAALGL